MERTPGKKIKLKTADNFKIAGVHTTSRAKSDFAILVKAERVGQSIHTPIVQDDDVFLRN